MGENELIRLYEFSGWRCDSCRGLITSIEAGWVEWLVSERGNDREVFCGLHLVHRRPIQQNGHKQACRYNPLKEFRSAKTIVEGFPLERFVGPDGLMLVFSLLAAGFLPKAQVLELAKRMQIPGYEVAHNLLRELIPSGVVTPFLGSGFYLQSEIREVIACARRRK